MRNKTSALKILIPNPGRYNDDAEIRSHLSLLPYYKHLQERIQDPGEPFLDFYLSVNQQLESSPELLKPIIEPQLVENFAALFQMIAATILPLSRDNDLQYFALSTPYKFEVFFYSNSFSEYFSPDEDGYVTFPKERPFEKIQTEYVLTAYRLIFRKYFGMEITFQERRTNRWIDTVTGLPRYSRIHVDESFIEVSTENGLPSFPESVVDKTTGSILDLSGLQQLLPLSLFTFQGFSIRRSIADVTVEECVTEAKNALIDMQSDNPQQGYEKLTSAIETLIGLKNVEVSVSPFLKLNNRFVFYNKYSGTSILLKGISSSREKEIAYDQLSSVLNGEKKSLFIDTNGSSGHDQPGVILASYLAHLPGHCYVVVPVFVKNELIGMVEAVSPDTAVLTSETLRKLEPVYSFFEMACTNHISQFEHEVRSLILEKYTALQPIVEWKFLEEAWKYLTEEEAGVTHEIGTVSFDQVYPLYGAIDVKNSSTERSRCHQQDLLGQLELIESTLYNLREITDSSVQQLVSTLLQKNNGFRKKIAHGLLSEDEEKVVKFIDLEANSFFKELLVDEGRKVLAVTLYFESLDPVTGHLSKNRNDFDTSISLVNSTISRYLESAESDIQHLYPHYFEKSRSDGVEYNIYLGNSFTPDKAFEFDQLKKIRLWQLSVMAEITRLTHKLTGTIPIRLETTQLVLVYDKPICISFRNDERRFDVDGSESVRFEILKKRIDKVRIKNTGERLTKPGTIAIVYSHELEVEAYDEYFDFLQKSNILHFDKEICELEDLQGISGLKAIRVKVNVER